MGYFPAFSFIFYKSKIEIIKLMMHFSGIWYMANHLFVISDWFSSYWMGVYETWFWREWKWSWRTTKRMFKTYCQTVTETDSHTVSDTVLGREFCLHFMIPAIILEALISVKSEPFFPHNSSHFLRSHLLDDPLILRS